MKNNIEEKIKLRDLIKDTSIPEEVKNIIKRYERKNFGKVWNDESIVLCESEDAVLYEFRGNFFIEERVKNFKKIFNQKLKSKQNRLKKITKQDKNEFIENEEKENPGKFWDKEVERIYNINEKNNYTTYLCKFRERYYLEKRNKGQVKIEEISEKEAKEMIKEYEKENKQEIWDKEAEIIFSTEKRRESEMEIFLEDITLYKFRENYYEGKRKKILNNKGNVVKYTEEGKRRIFASIAKKMIEDYRKDNIDSIWCREAKEIYSTQEEKMCFFDGKYYIITKSKDVEEHLYKREEIIEGMALKKIDEYEKAHPQEIFKKEAELICDINDEEENLKLYYFRGRYFKLIKENTRDEDCCYCLYSIGEEENKKIAEDEIFEDNENSKADEEKQLL